MHPAGRGVVLNAGMAQRMLLPPLPRIVRLRREHMPVVLGHQERLGRVRRHLLLGPYARTLAGVREVVERVYILKQAALLEIPDTAGRTALVQHMRDHVRLTVKLIVVQALVDPDAPQHDARMISVLVHHFAHVLDRLGFPVRVADMLPAGHFGEHQESQPITRVDERLALRIMRGAYRGQSQLFLDNARVLRL